jgi:hypothetical protein
MLSAHPKAGKTTLFALLLRALADGKALCGLDTVPTRVYYVSEEQERVWAFRRRLYGIGDHVRFLTQPFVARAGPEEWQAFIEHVSQRSRDHQADLVVFDTLGSLWPVVSENDAALVPALMPLTGLVQTTGAGLLFSHHLKKADGLEGTGFRGSSALGGYVDMLVELRRHLASVPEDRRRCLRVMGRWSDCPPEFLVRLAEDGLSYEMISNPHESREEDVTATVAGILEQAGRPMTCEEIFAAWPRGVTPRRQTLLNMLRAGADIGTWVRFGRGVKGEPHRYCTPGLAQETPVPPSQPSKQGLDSGAGSSDMSPETYERELAAYASEGVPS